MCPHQPVKLQNTSMSVQTHICREDIWRKFKNVLSVFCHNWQKEFFSWIHVFCEVTVTLTFHHQKLINSSLSPTEHLSQILWNSLKVFHIYAGHEKQRTLNHNATSWRHKNSDMWQTKEERGANYRYPVDNCMQSSDFKFAIMLDDQEMIRKWW